MIRSRDIVAMAVHNLWQRKMRSVLNLLGIVVGCVVLLMTAAGVAGVKDALHVLFDSAEVARQIGILPDLPVKGEPPPEAIVAAGEMSDERRQRMNEQLKNRWEQANRVPGAWELTTDQIAEIEQLPHVVSVVPRVRVGCTVSVGDSPRVSDGISGIDVHSRIAADRVIAGQMLDASAVNEVLVHEFVAYQLGFQSDAQLDELVGQTLDVEYQAAHGKAARIYNLLTDKWGQLSVQDFLQQAEFLAALSKLVRDVDATSLSDQEKELIRGLMRSEVEHEPSQPRMLRKSFRISGIVREGNADSLAQLFRGHYQDGYGGIVVPSHVASAIHLEANERPSFYDAVVTVDSTRHLQVVTEALEKKNTRTLSALRIIESMDEHVDESAWIVVGIAAAILLTAAIGISNTLLISVLERTPEFGILKSVGATNSTLLWLMVCEGAILGILGAGLAISISFVLSVVGHELLRAYVESRLNSDIATTLFQFSLWPTLGVVAVAVVVCVLASILPAWRAARLDPIVAMRRT